MALYIEAGFDLADLGGYTLGVVETGGTGASFDAELATGRHFLWTSAATATGDFASRAIPYVDFLTALVTELEAHSTATYTATFDGTTERVTITCVAGATGITSIALTATLNGGLIGHTTVHSGALTYAMDITPEYWISGDVGFWSDYHEQESDEDIGFTSRMHDGTPYGVAKDGCPTFVDMTVALEPRAKVYTAHATAADPWTWQKLFKHARNVYPITIWDGTLQHFLKLRRPAFKPLRRSSDYQGHFDIRLETELLGRK